MNHNVNSSINADFYIMVKVRLPTLSGCFMCVNKPWPYKGSTLIPHICHGSHGYIRVNLFWSVYIFTDLTRKIGVFGVNFILQKFWLCKKNDKYEVWFDPCVLTEANEQ